MYLKQLSLLALLAISSTAASRQLLQTQCPIDPASTELDFSGVAQSCGSGDVCSGCICSLVDVFAPALAAGGVTFNAKDPSSFPLATAAGIIQACSEQYLVSMLTANVNVTRLAGLGNCDFSDASNVPDCLVTSVSALAVNATSNSTSNSTRNVTATARVDDADLTYDDDDLTSVTFPNGIAVPLRVATVQATSDGPIFTIVGQLNSATQLIQAMQDSPELSAAMSPAAIEQLNSLSKSATTVDANPATKTYLASLENPINGPKLLTQLQMLAQGMAVEADVANSTTVAPTASGAPAVATASVSAPPNSASGRGVTAFASVGALLLAAMLL